MNREENLKRIQKLKVGDLVIVDGGYGRPNPLKVSKVGSTYVCLSAFTTDNWKFSKSTGKEIGGSKYSERELNTFVDETLAAYDKEQNDQIRREKVNALLDQYKPAKSCDVEYSFFIVLEKELGKMQRESIKECLEYFAKKRFQLEWNPAVDQEVWIDEIVETMDQKKVYSVWDFVPQWVEDRKNRPAVFVQKGDPYSQVGST